MTDKQSCNHAQLYCHLNVTFVVPVKHDSPKEVQRAHDVADRICSYRSSDDPIGVISAIRLKKYVSEQSITLCTECNSPCEIEVLDFKDTWYCPVCEDYPIFE